MELKALADELAQAYQMIRIHSMELKDGRDTTGV
jgi:hypothetical protein